MIILRRPKLPAILVISIVLLALIRPVQTSACGPFFTDAIFVYTKHPDMPLEKFAGGGLGVLRPTYARSYLVAAYRALTNHPFDAKEAEGINSLWNDRLNNNWDLHDDDWVKAWREARKQVPNAVEPPEIHAFRNREKPHEYETYLNCQQDAFENAARTLNERIKKFGAESGQVRDWLTAQDTVFSNCGGGRQIPNAAESNADAIIRADRAYQIAAANFYSGAFDEAGRQFDAIAGDPSSPWRAVAPYLAARALLRKGSFAEKEAERTPALTEAETRLNAVLRDRTLAASHSAAARLLNLTRLRLHPQEKLRELAHAILNPDAAADFKQEVWDYTVLLDTFVGDDEKINSQSVPATIRADELTDWILTFQDLSSESSSHALEQWQKTRSLPWLVAAISLANADSSSADTLIEAAAKVDAPSPAFASVAYHRVRLLIESGRTEDARHTLDNILANDRALLPLSAVNLLTGQRMTLALTLEGFLRDAQLKPAGLSDNFDGREIPEDEKDASKNTNGATLFFDLETANIFNRNMPVTVIKDAARTTILAPNLRLDLAKAAFVRAMLLNDRESAVRVASVLSEAQPELRELVGNYERARTADAQRSAATYLLLKFPGLRPYVNPGIGRTTPINEIDNYRDNWWCAEPPSIQNDSGEGSGKQTASPRLPAFLESSSATAAKELALLRNLGTAPNYLCRAGIDFANSTPNDPRAPEVLYLAVKATRYGCTDKETGRWSKAAFDLLHRRYPNTSWAKDTKYWFKD